MDYKNDWIKTRERFSAFWNNEIIDRCCVSVTAPKNGSNFIYEALPKKAEDKLKYWTDGEWILKRNLAYFENTCFYGDAFPQVTLNFGAAGSAGFFKNVRHQFEDTIWFFPFIKDYETDLLEFDPNSFLYRKTIDVAQYLVNESKGSFFVSTPDISGNIDSLAHMRGSDNILMDMMTDEDIVVEALKKIQDVRTKTSNEVFKIVTANNDGGSCIGWLNTWGEGKHDQMQCDLSVMISPQMFEEFAMPELKAQSAWLDHPLYHFDGIEQIRHLDMLLSIKKLEAIQWTCVEGQPSPLEFIPVLQKIQQAGKKIVMWIKPEELEPLMQQLSSKGLLLLLKASSEDEAKAIVHKAEKLTHE